jgi:N-acyl-L-homoserine lactone synthetase
MLHIVTQKNQDCYKDVLAQAFQKREFEFPLLQEEIQPFSKLPEAVYFVGVDDRAGVCGLARLLPTTGCHIDGSFALNEKPKASQPWELSAIHFFLPTDIGILRSESLLATTASLFYYELFESLYHFSCEEKIQRILVLDNFAILQDLAYVGWPLRQVERRQVYLPSPLSSCPLAISSESFQEFCANGQEVENRGQISPAN